jgi:hypothetical protein
LSVIIRFGSIPCFRISRVSNRRAALVLRPVLNDFVENISILIDGTPEPVSFTIDADRGFVQIPGRNPSSEARIGLSCLRALSRCLRQGALKRQA